MIALTPTELRRFLSKVEVGEPDDCWRWLGSYFSTGYPAFWLDGQNRGGHRVMATVSGIVLEDGQIVMHRCDNPGCVNPAHLVAGTMADNSADMVAKGRNRRGDDHPNSKLSREKVAIARAMREQGATWSDIGRKFDVSYVAVRNAVIGRTWA